MQAEFWLERWQQNQIGFHAQEINSHLQNYWSKLKLPKKRRIFVPLCGKSSDMLWLLAQGYEVLGVELSPLAAQSFFADNQLNAKVRECGAFQCWEIDGLSIYQGDFFALTREDLAACNAIYDRAALIALPAEIRQKYAQHLKQIAPSLTDTLLITLEYDQNEMQGPPFSVTEQEVSSLFGGVCEIECLFAEDCLAENEHLKNRGLSHLMEKVYWLKACSSETVEDVNK
ncbi:MAG: thiopurine S-methyltransferase [Methyloprofundus sp.]|nr:thiopurine S-methyltransferase [Methyloprofundus sp.]MDT8424654.1 thiopurine S-methyltransferase [Methyloprofundus sp.]